MTTPTTQALEPELPPLPQMTVASAHAEGIPLRVWGFTTDQMRAYALAAIEADRNKRALSPAAADAVMPENAQAIHDFALLAIGNLTLHAGFEQAKILAAEYRRLQAALASQPKDEGKEDHIADMRKMVAIPPAQEAGALLDEEACTEPNRAICPRMCHDFCNEAEIRAFRAEVTAQGGKK